MKCLRVVDDLFRVGENFSVVYFFFFSRFRQCSPSIRQKLYVIYAFLNYMQYKAMNTPNMSVYKSVCILCLARVSLFLLQRDWRTRLHIFQSVNTRFTRLKLSGQFIELEILMKKKYKQINNNIIQHTYTPYIYITQLLY